MQVVRWHLKPFRFHLLDRPYAIYKFSLTSALCSAHISYAYMHIYLSMCSIVTTEEKCSWSYEIYWLRCRAYWEHVGVFRPIYSKRVYGWLKCWKKLHAFFTWLSLVLCWWDSKIRVRFQIFARFFSIWTNLSRSPQKWVRYCAWLIYYFLIVESLWTVSLVLFRFKE